MNAHDLLWGMRPDHLPADAPDWARQVLLAGHPVVVRRAVVRAGRVAVGVRGGERAQRLAAELPLACVERRCCPEQLRADEPVEAPALLALRAVTPLMDATGLDWGPAGSAGYQLATGLAVLHAASDLDLVLRTAEPWTRRQARALFEQLSTLPCRIDLQLQTPHGGVALGDWAGQSKRVLLKRDAGACLVEDPWFAERVPA